MERKFVRFVSATMRALAIVALFFLAACQTPQEVMAENQLFCARSGFTYGTPEFGQCMLFVAQKRHEAELATRANMMGAGALLYQSSLPAYTYRPSAPLTCTQQGVFTNCF